MVRTRKMGSVDDDLSSHDYRKRRETRISVKKEEEVEESDESVYLPLEKKRKVCQSNSARSKTSNRPKSRTNFVGIEKSLKNGTHQNQGLTEDEDDLMEPKDCVAEQNNGYCSGIRRSTRQRKSTYNTLNQGWLLGSGRPRDFTGLTDDVSVGEQLRKDSSDHRKLKKDGDEDSSSHGASFEDMYTRIKRDRRTASRDMYNEVNKKPTSLSCQPEESDDSSNEETPDTEDDDDEEEEEEEDEEGDAEFARHLAGISEDETHDDDSRNTKYYLRQKKPMIDRFQMPIEPQRPRKQPPSGFHMAPGRRRDRSKDYRSTFLSPAHRPPRFSSRRHATHNSSTLSSSSSSSDEGDERRFERRKSKSMARARNRCLPMNITQEEVALNDVLRDRNKVGSSLADVDPMAIDRAVTFESVGGHNNHVQSLKEMLLLPLMYREVFEKFRITPPRGVLFYGPPGTGKTLVARALANECSQGERRVAFFMRKGADCLSKWVGESERQLRLLFDQAYSMRPSIIFFDEIDGLAPVRSTRQDQIHSSIVSTLLALMDGLDSRGEVVVIGATNRIDAIDPALRRPGRFDREFNFPLPSFEARLSILKIHTKEWNPLLDEMFLEELAEKTVGYCGADLKALCAETTFLALRRRYPQIYLSRQKLQLDISSIKIEAKDFYKAISKIVPVAQRSATAPGRPLSPCVRPLLLTTLNHVLEALKSTFPQGFTKSRSTDNDCSVTNGQDACDLSSDEGSTTDDHPYDALPPPTLHLNGMVSSVGVETNSVARNLPSSFNRRHRLMRYRPNHRPRLLLAGHKGQGQSIHLAPAILHHLERFPTQKLDLPALYAVSAKSPEESCSQIFLEAQRNLPSILYLPHVGQWWDTLSDTVRATFLTLLNDLEPTTPLLLLATSDCPFSSLPPEVQELFDPLQGEVINMSNPNKAERRQFFSDLILYEAKRPPRCKRKRLRKFETLPLAPPPESRTLSEIELNKLREHEENTMRELRLFLREILDKLARDRRFVFFTKPVDTEEVTDYLQVIKEPMDLETMMTKIDLHMYESVADFLDDISLICHNALEYNPDRDPSDKVIRHRACALRDAAHCLLQTELDPEFEQICQEIKEARKKRGDSPTKYAPKRYRTLPRLPPPLKLTEIEEEMQSAEMSGSSVDQRLTRKNAPLDCDYPTRYSRRLRGLDTSSADVYEKSDDQCGKGHETTSEPSKEPRTIRKVPTLRRRSSIWFGQRRRAVGPTIVESCSEDSSDTKQHSKMGAVEQPPPPPLLNGDLHEDVPRKASACFLSTPPVSPSSNACSKRASRGSVDSLVDSIKMQVCSAVSDRGATEQARSDNVRDVLDVGKDPCDETAKKELCRSPDSSKSSLGNTLFLSEPSVCDVQEVDTMPDITTGLPEHLDVTNCVNNGLVNGHAEMEEEFVETRVVVGVEQSCLCRLLDAVVTQTEGVAVEHLEKLHYRLHQLVRLNRKEWDRTGLLNDIEKEIERLSCRSATR